MTKDVRNFLFGTILVGGLVTGAAACSQKGDKKQTEFDKTQDGAQCVGRRPKKQSEISRNSLFNRQR